MNTPPYTPTANNKEISKMITFLRFPAILLVVTLHAYTSARGLDIGDAECYMHLSYILSLCLGEMGVPLFFTISGFLFFKNYNSVSKYSDKIKTRAHTLLIPYLFWNAFMILFYWILQSIPQLSGYFSGSNLPIADYNSMDFIRAFWDCGHWDGGNGLPILQPYWYIRNLMLLNILSPILYYYIKFTKWFGIIIPACCWIVSPNLAFSFSSITFFLLGAIFSISPINIASLLRRKQKAFLLIFITLLIIEYIFHFYISNPYNSFLHRIVIISGIPFLFSLSFYLQNKFSIPSLLTKSAFLVYTIHFPIIIAIRKIEFKLISTASDSVNIIFYFTSIILSVSICIGIYYILNKFFPRFTGIITGR